MIQNILILFILLPLVAGIAVFASPRKFCRFILLTVTLLNLGFAVFLFRKNAVLILPWAGAGIDFSLRLYHFSGFIILAAAVFSFLIALYSISYLQNNAIAKQFYAYLLISVSFINGAVLADNLVLLLFFWEGLLGTLFGFIAIGGKQSFKTATKAFIIVAVCDLCMMAGIALAGHLAGTLAISNIHLPLDFLGGIAFTLLVIGAVSKGGSMPFHTWIPDAAIDAPLPFMAFFPGVIEKLLGIYFLTRITLDMFQLKPQSTMSIVLMTLGAITIILAVMMALVQKDYKRLLSYHAISQVGYMILGIGTCLPAGIIGGVFHMLNNALYKCCLFFTAGSVEKQAGTTDLEQLGGLAGKMPFTFASFIVAALSISGIPPFNGFFSKELVYDAALERGVIFYLAALLGSFFTAASFLKLGHAAFVGKIRLEHKKEVKEAPVPMLISMIILASLCVIFGIFNYMPVNNFIRPILGEKIEWHRTGVQVNLTLGIITLLVSLGAFIHHLLAAKIMGGGIKASEHIYHAPVLSLLYRWAEKKYFDPYEIGIKLVGKISTFSWQIDRSIDWIYESLVAGAAVGCSKAIRRMHTGYYVIYVVWSLLGTLVVMLFILNET